MQLFQLVNREIRVIYHRGSEIFNLLMFFLIVSFTFSFAAGGALSAQVGAAVIIVCFMLASNLSGHSIFERDIESGVLQQLFLRSKSLNNLIFAKIISQYLCFGIPLVLVVPVVSLFFGTAEDKILSLVFVVVVTSFILSIINVMINGITAGIRSGAIISVIISLPLYIPIIILDISFITNIGTEDAISITSFLKSAGGYALIIIPLSIFAVRHTIRNAVEN